MVFIVVKDGINQQQWEYDGYILVGGLEHGFYFSHILGMIIPTVTHSIIFQRGCFKHAADTAPLEGCQF
jgi:hypothetical protein